uniref:Tyrosine-protein phosphatase domain-containing protein n=1 Tax=Setaria digitata TaxID=48799 RepID=A0A915Q3P2_9BILA
MDERYQNNSRNYARIVQKNTDSGYNYSNFGRSAEPVRSGTNLRAELYDTNKTSLYGQEQRPQLEYASDLKRQQYRSRSGEYPSYMYGEPERNYSSRHDIELQLDPGRRPKRDRHQKHGWKCSHRSRHRHRRHKHHHSKINWEQVLAGEGYPVMQKAISAGSISPALVPAEMKVTSTPTPQPSPENWLSGLDQRKKKTEERTEEKEKSNEKATKSSESSETGPLHQILKAKKMEESAATKREQTDEDEQHIICIDQTRIVLRCGTGDSDFIHASRIPLGDNPNEIIIAQLPLPNTVRHFWEMVWQENVQAVLLFLTLSEWKQHAENIQLIPEKGSLFQKLGHNSVVEGFMMLTDKNEFNVTSDWIVREYYLSKGNETRRILWHHYSAWEPNKAPRDCEHFWPLHSSLRKVRRPYVCMSLAGAGRAGCYAALEKIRKEILSDQATFEATKKCSLIEYKFYRSDGYPANDDFDL